MDTMEIVRPDIPAEDDQTRNLAQYLTNSIGRHTAAEEAAPKNYVGRHRVADGQLSTLQVAAERADALAALTGSVAE